MLGAWERVSSLSVVELECCRAYRSRVRFLKECRSRCCCSGWVVDAAELRHAAVTMVMDMRLPLSKSGAVKVELSRVRVEESVCTHNPQQVDLLAPGFKAESLIFDFLLYPDAKSWQTHKDPCAEMYDEAWLLEFLVSLACKDPAYRT